MTTATIVSTIDHTSDATFRVWVAEIITNLLAVGLTQTTDTGQINTSTVVRGASANTAAGYAVFRFNDTLQSTAPIFFKLEFGNGTTPATDPAIWITVGTGSNGSGTITGTTTGRCPVGQNATPSTKVNPYVSRFCYAAGASQGICWMRFKAFGANATGAAIGFFVIARSTNSSGACTADAYMLITNGLAAASGVLNSQFPATYYSYNTGALVAVVSAILYTFNPCSLVTTNLVPGNLQFFPVWHFQPTISVLATIACALMTDVADNIEVMGLALIGATTHTFLQQGQFSNGQNIGGVAGGGLLLIWE